jgi:hypothetical protein
MERLLAARMISLFALVFSVCALGLAVQRDLGGTTTGAPHFTTVYGNVAHMCGINGSGALCVAGLSIAKCPASMTMTGGGWTGFVGAPPVDASIITDGPNGPIPRGSPLGWVVQMINNAKGPHSSVSFQAVAYCARTSN